MARNLDWSRHKLEDTKLNRPKWTNPKKGFDKSWYNQREQQGYLTFGKFSGKHLNDVPVSYLRWLASTDNKVIANKAKKLLTSKTK